jgi:cytoskeletal protein RodZ
MKDSIGALLRKTRELRRLTIAQVSESTRVRSHYLQALEGDDLSAMPSTAQARGFLRNYAEFLGLEIDELLQGAAVDGPSATPTTADASQGMRYLESPPIQPSLLKRFRDRASRKPPASGKSDQAATDELLASEVEPVLAEDSDSAAPPESVASSSADSQAAPQKSNADPGLPKVPPEAADSAPNSVGPAAQVEEPQGEPGDSLIINQDATPSAPEESAADPDGGVGAAGRLTSLSAFLSRLWPRRGEPSPTADHGDEPLTTSLPEEPGSAQPPPSEPADLNLDSQESELAAESSNEVYADLGQQLRARREMLSLTYEEIERHTRVRASFLQALELGSLEELPSPVQTRGILANYAAFLDLDVDTILLRFADGLQARHREQKPHWQPPRTRPTMTVHTSLPPLRSFIASDLFFGVGVAVVLLIFAVWGISRVMSVRTSTQTGATAPPISEVLASTPASTVAQEVTLIPAQDTPLVSTVEPFAGTGIAPLDPGVAVQIHVLTSERTYMRVTVDGKVDFEGRTELGKDYTYRAASQVEILVGNAAALRVDFNGHDMGLMGSFGEVVDRIYTVQGVFTPTATPPPTPTATPNFTATPSITPTATPSATPTPKTGG